MVHIDSDIPLVIAQPAREQCARQELALRTLARWLYLALFAMLMVACGGEEPKPALHCEQVGSWQDSGCNNDGCWAVMQCNRQPEPDDYMGAAVTCAHMADTIDHYHCEW